MNQVDPNLTYRMTQHTDSNGNTYTIKTFEAIHSDVRVEDLLYFREQNRVRRPGDASPPPTAICWEMPDGKIIQLYPDVKVVDSLAQYARPEDCVVQTRTAADGTRNYNPEEHKLPWHRCYKEKRASWPPPWYVWPLRPILLWTFLLTMLFMFPLSTIAVFSGLSYCLIGYALFSRQLIPANESFAGYFLGFLMAPLTVLFMLIMGSLCMLPIL